jgi:hypothetical protein
MLSETFGGYPKGYRVKKLPMALCSSTTSRAIIKLALEARRPHGIAMKGAAMNWPKFVMTFVFSLIVANYAFGQECQSLSNALPAELVSFISAAVPSQDNAECIAWAITTLGAQKCEPAIPVLTKFLDFKRPPSDLEKTGLYLHPNGVLQVYPAAAALEQFGEKALPALINVIKGRSASEVATQNATAVLMIIHKYDPSKGIALLKQEEVKANDDSSKQRVRSAISTAVTKWCAPAEQANCKAAANKDEKN